MMEQWSKKVAGLSPEKQALLLQKLAAKQKTPAPAPPRLPTIVHAPDQRHLPFPLSDMQQAYWIGRNAGFELGNVATHFYQEFDGADLHPERLSRAWQLLIARHDMLRAVILPDGRQQVLAEVPPYTIAVTDLRAETAEAAEVALTAIRYELSHQVFRTDQWPLFEIRASRLSDTATRLHISVDGLILDAWSYQVLLREWFELYENPAARLAPLELTFRDYVLAEHALRETEIYQNALRYWGEWLPTLPPAPDLPLACDPRTLLAPRFRRLSARLEPQRWQRLHQRMLGLGLTPASVLLTAYAEIIGRWSKSQRFTLNVPRFNRLPLHPQVNQILGEFASFSLLAIDNAVQEPFAVRARRVQEQLWKDLEHGYVSGVQLLRELAQHYRQSAPISMPIVFTSAPQDVHGQQSALSISPSEQGDIVYNITQTSQVWLDHEFYEDGGALLLNWDAVEQLFLPGMLDDMFAAYVSLVQRLADDEQTWQSPTRELLPAHQRELRAAVNATATPMPDVVLQELFEAQVRERPDEIAVLAGSEALSYAELHERARQVGQTLHRLGARPNTLVAVVMEKSIEQVISVLGILYAGAAYLPIDLNLPSERVSYLLTQSEVTLVLTQSWLDATREWPPEVQRLCVDADEFDAPTDDLAAAAPRPDDLAYVIYTSGSTGQPKGVMITHRGVVNAVLDTNRRFAIGPDDRVLALTALHHDMSVYDIFGLLAAGGTLVMPEHLLLRDPAHWAALLNQEQITLWNSVPAMLEMLLEYAAGRTDVLPSTLRYCFVGGDWLAVTLPQRLATLVPSASLISVGGPTETTLWNIMYVVETPDPSWTSIPYGRSIANTRYYVLNEAQEDCPTWVPGELVCAGVGVARGYWRDPVKTAERFIPNPFAQERLEIGDWRYGSAQSPISNLQSPISNRLYKTGDLGRYLPDGTIEFLGRSDLQVKINGLRIELGEIEAALLQHPQVRAVVVSAVGPERGAKRLVAHVVPQEQADGMLLDPAARIEFKLRQRGIRPIEPGQPTTPLHRPELDRATLLARRTHRSFQPAPLALEQLGGLLSVLAYTTQDDSPFPKYRYPSGGGLYPVQTYLYVKPGRVADLAGGIYYYHPREHQLVLVMPDARLDASIVAPHNRAIFEQAAFYLLLIGQLDAITPMYGELARDLCLLEAGYIGQLLMSAAPDYTIGLCPIGSLQDDAMRPLLALDEHQIVLHSVLGGVPADVGASATASPERALVQPVGGETTEQLKTATAIQEQLQAFLRPKLPEHMIPTSITILDSLPLTPNGKVDRKALAAMLSSPQAGPAVHVAPRNELERTLTTIWQEVLQSERVGVHDNFFDLGGNSLHIVQIHTRIRESFGRDVPITVLFKNPTISFLAQHLSQAQPEPPSFEEVHDRGQRQKQALQRRRRPPGGQAPHE